MAKFVKLPVKFSLIDYDELKQREEEEERLKELGIKPSPRTLDPDEIEIGDMWFNVDHIVRFNETDEGNMMVVCSDDFSMMVYITKEEFLNKINE